MRHTILFPTPLRPSPPPPPTSRRPLFRGSKSAAKSGHDSVILAEWMVGAILRWTLGMDGLETRRGQFAIAKMPRILSAARAGRIGRSAELHPPTAFDFGHDEFSWPLGIFESIFETSEILGYQLYILIRLFSTTSSYLEKIYMKATTCLE